jgi:3-dehydroquinate dehydratase II
MVRSNRWQGLSVKPILILNGPNLNLLGQRQPDIYGHATLADIEALCAAAAKADGLSVICHQSNHEGVLIDHIHVARGTTLGIVINAGAFTHTSVAILDALHAYDGPVVEVHLSNVHKREAFRHHSHISLRADALIAGAGPQGYALAIRHIADRAKA